MLSVVVGCVLSVVVGVGDAVVSPGEGVGVTVAGTSGLGVGDGVNVGVGVAVVSPGAGVGVTVADTSGVGVSDGVNVGVGVAVDLNSVEPPARAG